MIHCSRRSYEARPLGSCESNEFVSIDRSIGRRRRGLEGDLSGGADQFLLSTHGRGTAVVVPHNLRARRMPVESPSCPHLRVEGEKAGRIDLGEKSI